MTIINFINNYEKQLIIFLFLISGIHLLSGIIILNEDYYLWKKCNNNHLWIYILISIICFFNKHTIYYLWKNYDLDEIYNCIMIIFFIEFALTIWGGVELFYNSTKCNLIEDSNLWYYGLLNFIFQVIYSSVLFISGLILIIFNNIMNKRNNTILNNYKNNVFVNEQISDI